MTRRYRSPSGHHCYDPASCLVCEYAEHVAEQEAFERDLESADAQRELDAADREAGMGRWS